MIYKNRHHTAKNKHEMCQIHLTAHDTFKVFKKNLIFRRNADYQNLLRLSQNTFFTTTILICRRCQQNFVNIVVILGRVYSI